MCEGAAEELFRPFVQRPRLGLGITQEAIAAMGGEIGVRNLSGKGCVFSVKLR